MVNSALFIHPLMNIFEKNLFGRFEELGWHVDQPKPEQAPHFDNHEGDNSEIYRDLEERMRTAELIFYDNYGFNRRHLLFYGIGYLQEAERLVHDKFLSKSHLNARDLKRRYHYKRFASERVAELGIPVPEMMGVEDYLLSPTKTLPVILKEDIGTGGKGVFLIDKANQMKRFWRIATYHEKGGLIMAPRRDWSFVQRYIETPSDFYTHVRIFTLGDGQIVGSVLNRSTHTKSSKVRIAKPGSKTVLETDIYRDLFDHIGSPYYLGLLDFASNVANGGRQIPLARTSNSQDITEEDAQVLVAHGINPQNPTLNTKLSEYASTVARRFSQFGMIYAGQDWIQDQEGNFYFLEINHYPGIEIFNTLFNHGEGNSLTAARIGSQKVAEKIMNYREVSR